MSQEFTSSHFYVLPNEVLIKILNKIDTFTLLNFCEIYDCDYFLEDRNVIRTIHLHRTYGLRDLSTLSKKIVFEYVTTLNVNCLYWVQAAKLRRFVTRLVNLETLYAIHSNLSLTSSDTEVFSKSKIKKLGVSVNRNDELGSHRISSVETLYINVVKATTLISPLILDMLFPHLRKFWIDVEEPCGREVILHCLNAGNNNKIFCQVKAPIPSINFEHYWLTTYYNNRRASQPYVMCCEKFTAKQLRSKSIFEIDRNSEESWRILDELHCSKPYGPRDARKLYLNEQTLDSIDFEELNFYHSGPICNTRSRKAAVQILESPRTQKLKKLCVMMCLLENKNLRESVKIQDSNGFTRKRIGLVNTTQNHPIEKVFRNFTNLQHLEIYVCNQTSHHSAIQAYPLISIFEKLKCLVVEIPITLDGSFLNEVLQKCKHLQRLIITSRTQHEKLNFNLASALPNATSLKDFRFENHRIQLDKLLERLCVIKTKKMERIVLICNEIDKLSSGPLTQFLELNPQLIFLYFLIRGSTESAVRNAQQTLNVYKKQHPSKFFLIKKNEVFNRIGFPIPNVHFCEMVKNENNVASLDALRDFIDF